MWTVKIKTFLERLFNRLKKSLGNTNTSIVIIILPMTTPLETLNLGRLSNVKPSVLGEAFSPVLSYWQTQHPSKTNC